MGCSPTAAQALLGGSRPLMKPQPSFRVLKASCGHGSSPSLG